VSSLRVSPVSERPVTSRAQIWLLTCGFFRSSKAHGPVGLPWVRAHSFPGGRFAYQDFFRVSVSAFPPKWQPCGCDLDIRLLGALRAPFRVLRLPP
jgi:hypothetical protein